MNKTSAQTALTTPQPLGSWGDEPAIIPFADPYPNGSVPPKQTPAPQDMGVSANDEFGSIPMGKPVSLVDRDLGLNTAPAQSPRAGRRRYACPCCGQGASRVMRVRLANSRQNQPRWVALCAMCAASMLVRYPGTIVGGMVRPTRRKRSNRVRPERRYAQEIRGVPQTDRYRRAG